MLDTTTEGAAQRRRVNRARAIVVVVVLTVSALVLGLAISLNHVQYGQQARDGIQEVLDRVAAEPVFALDDVFTPETAAALRDNDVDGSALLVTSPEARDTFDVVVDFTVVGQNIHSSATHTTAWLDVVATYTLTIGDSVETLEWRMHVGATRGAFDFEGGWRIHSVFGESLKSSIGANDLPPKASGEPACPMSSLAIPTTLSYKSTPAPGGCMLPTSLGTELVAPTLAPAVAREPGTPGLTVDTDHTNEFLPSQVGTCWEGRCPFAVHSFSVEGVEYRGFMVAVDDGTGRVASLQVAR